MNDAFDDRTLDDEAARARASEDRYRTIFEEANDFIFTTGLDQRIASCNPATAAALGMLREQVVGRSIAEFISQDDFEGANRRLAAKLAGGGATRYELNVAGAGGKRMVWEINSRLNRDADGRPAGLHIIARDVTERHEIAAALRASEARLADELADAKRLQEISGQLIGEGEVEALYGRILDASIEIMRSDMGSMQIFCPEPGALKLIVWKGFHSESAAHWEWVPIGSSTSCGMALGRGVRIQIDDVEACDDLAGTSDLDHYRLSGIVAVQSTPLIARDGRIVGVISTHWRHAHSPDERELGLLDILARQAADLIERKQSEEALRRSEALHDLIVESAVDYAIIATDLDGLVTAWNAGARNLFGYDPVEVMGLPGDVIFTPEDREAGRPAREMALALENGRALNERPHRRKDGTRLWASGLMMPLRDRPDGEPIGFVKIAQDRTEQRRSEEHQRLLVAELNHRVKNTLAIVQAIARQSLKGEGVAGDARRAFEGRLQALAGAHSLLTRENWDSADLGEVVAHALHACRGDDGHSEIEGPPLRLGPKAAVSVAMALHELCTNAVKYGGLSVEGGQVSVVWNIVEENGEPRLKLRWRESGGPPVAEPERRSFGTRMIERGLASELHGTVQLAFEPDGLCCAIDAPLPALGRAEEPVWRV